MHKTMLISFILLFFWSKPPSWWSCWSDVVRSTPWLLNIHSGRPIDFSFLSLIYNLYMNVSLYAYNIDTRPLEPLEREVLIVWYAFKLRILNGVLIQADRAFEWQQSLVFFTFFFFYYTLYIDESGGFNSKFKG